MTTDLWCVMHWKLEGGVVFFFFFVCLFACLWQRRGLAMHSNEMISIVFYFLLFTALYLQLKLVANGASSFMAHA